MKQLGQTTHRWLVISIFVLVASFYLPVVEATPGLVFLVAALTLIPIFLLQASLGARFDEIGYKLDERQVLVKYAHFKKSQRLLQASSALIMVAIIVLESHALEKALLATLLILIFGMPSFVSAWLEPDPITNESPAKGEFA